jgi:hypothetical protein
MVIANHQNVELVKEVLIDRKTSRRGITFVITFFGEV